MHDELHQRGLQILAFPCNQFALQEPQSAEKIEACVRQKHEVAFPLLQKVNVNGADAHDVFRWLRLKSSPEPIPWNFHTFLVSRDGESCTRFANSRTPLSIKAEIEAVLVGAPMPASEQPEQQQPEVEVPA